MEAYEGTPPSWLKEGLREVLRRVHGSGRLKMWLIPRWGPCHGGEVGGGGAETAERGRADAYRA